MRRRGSWSVAMCDESIMLPSVSLSVISFDIITGTIVAVAFFLGVYLHLILQLLSCSY